MNSDTSTEPIWETRPTSLRPRSTSITCSARSLGSPCISAASRSSSASFLPRGCVPAIGRSSTRPSSMRTSTSGEEPTMLVLPRRRKKRYGDGLMLRRARYTVKGSARSSVSTRRDILLGLAHALHEGRFVHARGEALLAHGHQRLHGREAQGRGRAGGAGE